MKNLLTVLLCLFTVLLSSSYSHAAQSKSSLYFPHVASGANWETEIGIINTGAMTLEGVLYAYDSAGIEVENINVILASGARSELTVGTDFNTPIQISYITFEYSIEASCSGYEKFYVADQRVAIPAVATTNSDTIYISHIASNANWWTGFALVNTTKEAKTLNFTFSDGSQHPVTIDAKHHWAGTLASSFPNVDAANIESATITNTSGIIGLELFGSTPSSGSHYLSGILLSDQTSHTLYYPHVASDVNWWTGIVSYNPIGDTSLLVTPYSKVGEVLTPSSIEIAEKSKYVGTVAGLNLPDETAWFKVEATSPITGFELFGQKSGSQLGGYSSVNIKTKQGTFVKADHDGWTGIAFVNTEVDNATVELTASSESGATIASTTMQLVGNGKQVNIAEAFFDETNISEATYLKFNSDKYLVGFQLNSSADGMKLDGLPAINAMARAVFSAGDADVFQDVNLKQRILELGLPLSEITTLSCEECGITSIEGIQALTNLTSLNLEGNAIVDASPLAGLTHLINLNLARNQIDDIGFLEHLVHLISLDLNGCLAADFSLLMQLDSLLELDLENCQLTDISLLSGMDNLVRLWLYDNRISDLSPLVGLVNLVELGLDNNQVVNLEPLRNLTKLRSLQLDQNRVTDTSVLQYLTELSSLELENNQLRDITPLQGLTHLRWLELEGNMIEEVTTLEHLSDLSYLSLGDNPIRDFSSLQWLVNLDGLDLWNSQISDLSPLHSLVKLTELSLSSNQISDLSVLQGLSLLTEVDVRYNCIDDFSPVSHVESVFSSPQNATCY